MGSGNDFTNTNCCHTVLEWLEHEWWIVICKLSYIYTTAEIPKIPCPKRARTKQGSTISRLLKLPMFIFTNVNLNEQFKRIYE